MECYVVFILLLLTLYINYLLITRKMMSSIDIV